MKPRFSNSFRKHPKRAAAFITGYLLFGLALLSVVTLSIVTMNNQQSEAQVFQKRREEIINDALYILSAIRACALLYPAGNNNDSSTAIQFPKRPSSGDVADLVCPGDPANTDTSALTLWETITRSGAASNPAPSVKIGMKPWKYVNSNKSDGSPEVYFYIEPISEGNNSSNSLIQSLANNYQIKSAGFTATTVVAASGATIWQLRSRNLAIP